MASGQARLLAARRPIERTLQDPAIPETLRHSLELVRSVRAFAKTLGLSVGSRYREYAPWPGDRVVTTVVATRPGEVEPAGFWFPIVGRVPYKGYFDVSRAEAEAARLRADGLDVCQVPVRAYSTLGWFDDPVTDPMLQLPEGELVETLIHELLHATVFVPGDADFDEGVASFVGEEGRVRFFAATEGPEAAARQRAQVAFGRRVRSELLRLRRAVAALYQQLPPGPERADRRQQLEHEARARLAALHDDGRDGAAWADSLRLNDACLALTATYASDTACYARVLAELGGDLRRFVARVREAGKAEQPRAALLGDVSCPEPETPKSQARAG